MLYLLVILKVVQYVTKEYLYLYVIIMERMYLLTFQMVKQVRIIDII